MAELMQLSSKEARALVAHIEGLPAMPAAAMRLLSAIGRDLDFTQIDHIVRSDEAIAARVLRIANSVVYNPRGGTVMLPDAVRRLGTRALVRIAMETEIGGLLAEGGRAYGMRRGDLSEAAVGGAIAAGLIAKRVSADEGLCFAGALLRDVGKIVIDSLAGPAALDALADRSEGLPFLECEHAQFGADHAELGAALAQQWKLPDSMARLIRLHHTPPQDPPDLACDVVHAADWVARFAGLGLGADGMMYPFDSGARVRLGLTRADLEPLVIAVLTETTQQRTAAKAAFGRTT